MINTPRLTALAAVIVCHLACSSSDDGTVNRNGGTSGSGGAAGSGGAGGAHGSGTGGSTGGASSTGGTTGGGGASASGGALGDAGSGGASSAGGTTGSGGAAGNDAASETAGPDLAPGGPFALSSTAHVPGQEIAAKYRCRTENVSPPLTWTPGPAGTKSYAIIMVANMSSLHWVIWDIPASVLSLPEAVKREAMLSEPAGAKQARVAVDGSDWYGYSGPCPQSANRRYDYILHALPVATLPNVTPDSGIQAVANAIRAMSPTASRTTLTWMASR